MIFGKLSEPIKQTLASVRELKGEEDANENILASLFKIEKPMKVKDLTDLQLLQLLIVDAQRSIYDQRVLIEELGRPKPSRDARRAAARAARR